MISAILSLLGSSAVGSLIGGLFAWLNRKNELENKKLDHQLERDRWGHELQVRQADLEQIKAEAQGRREVAVVEGEATIEAARMAAIGAAQEADKLDAKSLEMAGGWRWALILTEAFRRIVRPLATVVLVGFAIGINMMLLNEFRSVGWKDLPSSDKLAMALQAFSWVTGQAAAALSYWFMTRNTGGRS